MIRLVLDGHDRAVACLNLGNQTRVGMLFMPTRSARHTDRNITCARWVKRTEIGNVETLENIQTRITKIQ